MKVVGSNTYFYSFLNLNFSNVASKGVQDTLPQIMAPLHVEDFKLKEFEKTSQVEGSI